MALPKRTREINATPPLHTSMGAPAPAPGPLARSSRRTGTRVHRPRVGDVENAREAEGSVMDQMLPEHLTMG